MKNRYEEEGRRQGALKIMEALSGVDQELLIRTEDTAGSAPARGSAGAGSGKPNRSLAFWKSSRPWAALFCLALAGALSWGGYRMIRQAGGDSADFSGNSAGAAGGIGPEEGAAEAGGTSPGKGAGGISPEEGAVEDGGISPEEGAMEDGGEERSGDLAADKMESLENSQEKKDFPESECLSGGEEGRQDTDGMGGDTVSPEAAGGESDSCPRINQIKYSEEEARNQETLGGYLPEEIPAGYLFESAWCNGDIEESNLTMVWSRGMDSIVWSVSIVEEPPETVDSGLPETYDLRLYTVPYSESVPAGRRESVDNPVFSREDLSMETVAARMIAYNDSGDTDTPRGNFSVLYPGNVLVSFNGRGNAEEIWEMFSSLEVME